MRLWRVTLEAGARAFLLTAILGSLVCSLQAQVMTSGSFQIESDSVNFGGGLSTSTSYRQESTFGEVATGNSTSTNYQLLAGYQQMHTAYLSLSVVAGVDLAPSLGGLVGGVATGTTSFVVVTDNRAGYRATLEAQDDPAMQATVGVIANYVPGTSEPDFSYTTSAAQAHFGFTPEGTDISARYRDNGALCGVGSADAVDACWDMVSTTPVEIVRRTTPNHPVGATTTLKFQVGIGASAGVTAGLYTATSTITAITL